MISMRGLRTLSRQAAAAGRRRRRDLRPVVVHVGEAGPVPCGIAQMLNEYLSWPFASVQVRVLASTRGRGDRLAPLRTLACVVGILGCRLSRRRHAFVVHLSSGGSFVREGGLAALVRAIGFPLAVQLHGSVFVPFAAAHPRLVRAVLRLAARVYVLTEQTAGVAAALLDPDGGGRIVKVANGVAVAVEPPPGAARDPVVVFAGQVGKRKGADVLLAAWARLHELHPGWRLVVAGPVLPEIAVLPVPAGATLLGPVSRAEVHEWQTTAAVAVLPSRNEALPMFLLEAMAHACAVVATPVGEVAELLDGCGRVVPVDDPEALAAALDGLMADPAAAAALGAAARQRVIERYSSTALQSLFEGEWQVLLEGARRS